MKYLQKYENIFTGKTTRILKNNGESIAEIKKHLDPDDDYGFFQESSYGGSKIYLRSKTFPIIKLSEKFLSYQDANDIETIKYYFLIDIVEDGVIRMNFKNDTGTYIRLVTHKGVTDAEAAAYFLQSDIDSILAHYEEATKYQEKMLSSLQDMHNTPSYGKHTTRYDGFEITRITK